MTSVLTVRGQRFIFMMFLVFAAVTAAAQQSNDALPVPETDTAASDAPAPAGVDEAEPGDAAETATVEQQPDLAELQRRIDLLAEEIEQLRSGEETQGLDDADARRMGLAPSAAAAYGRDRGVSIAGYGEMLLENFGDTNQAGARTGKTTQLDFLRAIIYAGYRFNDKFLFNSEIEVEHAKEIFVEFAYLDYQATGHFGVRGGMLLAPMGLVNEFHEPTVFLGAERPVTENRIIPSTWRENGAGVYGSHELVSYRAYVINGFNGSAFSSSGVRGGRQKGGKAKATSMAFTGRVDLHPTPGVFVGASLYSGDSGQGEIVVDGAEYGVRTTIFDIHGQAQARGLDLRGLFARAHLDDAAQLNRALGRSGSGGVAERMQGAYVQVGYNVLSQAPSTGTVALTPYIRIEQVDTQDRMPVGFARSLSTDNRYLTAGIELKPIPGIVVKVDHAWVSNEADSGINQFNINLGYAF